MKSRQKKGQVFILDRIDRRVKNENLNPKYHQKGSAFPIRDLQKNKEGKNLTWLIGIDANKMSRDLRHWPFFEHFQSEAEVMYV